MQIDELFCTDGLMSAVSSLFHHLSEVLNFSEDIHQVNEDWAIALLAGTFNSDWTILSAQSQS